MAQQFIDETLPGAVIVTRVVSDAFTQVVFRRHALLASFRWRGSIGTLCFAPTHSPHNYVDIRFFELAMEWRSAPAEYEWDLHLSDAMERARPRVAEIENLVEPENWNRTKWRLDKAGKQLSELFAAWFAKKYALPALPPPMPSSLWGAVKWAWQDVRGRLSPRPAMKTHAEAPSLRDRLLMARKTMDE